MNAPGLSKPMRLGPFDFELAPETPGIYAWYISTPFSAHDWKSNFSDGVDRTSSSFVAAIVEYAKYFGAPRLDLTGVASYQTEWTGSLHAPSIGASDKQLLEAADSPNSRRVVVALLREAVPDFASPAYIGVTVDLRTRLQQHKQAYAKAFEALKKEPDRADEVHRGGGDLGSRLAGAGVPLNDLSVVVLPINLPDISEAEARAAAAKAEWILQQIFQPPFGRR